jgi:DnaK suppressor protein
MRSGTRRPRLWSGVMKTMDVGTKSSIPRRWRWHHATLLRLQSALTRDHTEGNEALRAPHDERQPDRVDAATDEQEFRDWLAKLAREETELAEIREALARLHAGKYGICEKTGQPIAPERLRAVPWARCA